MANLLRVLIVEDNDDDRQLLAVELQSGGYDLVHACVASAGEMRAALDRDAWDVIISDYSMPGFSGIDALRIVQERGLDLPFIIVSGVISEDTAVDAMKSGAHDYLSKSNLKRLLPAAERELREAAARREHRLAVQALRDSEARFRTIFNQAAVGIVHGSLDGRFLLINDRFCDLLGYNRDELLGMTFQQITHADELAQNLDLHSRLRAGNVSSHAFEERYLRKDGSLLWGNVTASIERNDDGEPKYLIAVVEDITERKQMEQRLQHLNHFDSLTSLPNRMLFRDRLKQALAQAARNGSLVAVLFVDLDRFKVVNDTLGHGVGDKLLQAVAQLLLGCVRAGDTVGRLDGDGFALILPGFVGAHDAALAAQKLLDAFARPVVIDGHEIFVSVNIGITLYPSDSKDGEQLVRNSYTAMLRAKDLDRNSYQFYTAEMNAKVREKVQLENGLRRALEREEFLLHYQPKVDLASGEVTGLEALLRWRRGAGELVGPAQFIPLLEETGLIVPVGEWALNQACMQIKAWHDAGLPDVTVAVNLSARQFQSSDLVDMVRRVIKSSGINPRLLELELTESLLMRNADEAIGVLGRLRSMGVSLSVDDFGTGYSSLSYLKRFPLNTVKIDRSFVNEIVSDPDDASISRTIITLAHGLKLKVVAEGVETEAQMAFLAANHCDEMQGYYFSRPLAPEDCAALLRERRRLKLPEGADSTRQRTLLLVDDEAEIVTALERLLRRDGYRILTACSAREGLEQLAKNNVGVIISDQCMPEMTGVEFFKRVKELHPETVRIVLSDHTELQSVTDAINEGAVYKFLVKPWDDELLRAKIRGAFRHQELAWENEHLSGKLKAANAQLSGVNHKLQQLLFEKSRQVQQDEISLKIAQESLHHIPLAVVGVDGDGMVALANARAEAMFGNGVPLLGSLVGETPLAACLAGAVVGKTEVAEVGGQHFSVLCQTLGNASHARGRLLVLLPQGAM
ncbi:MAG: hypothetical protein A2143_05780 [Gallionellales bacterium RBG_16_57_15]|nr:MAG: hypothetical protein A2143_05780 [Gallionellales bacterium RBG_16_57_15]